MTEKKVHCLKLKKQLPGLSEQPMPGKLGEKIVNNISQQAWNEWLAHQTMLINEYRLNLLEPKSRQFLQDEMQSFLFKGTATKPPGYSED
jgi:Fe-S cluster biosynthesis and repair protein YggX